MRKFVLLAAAGLMAGCGLIPSDDGGGGGGGGGGVDPTSFTKIYANQYSYYDVSALKEGDWVEYESKSKAPGGGGDNVSKTRYACVKVDSLVWLEMTAAGYDGWYILVGIDKSDRNVKKAYMGEKDKEAKEIKVEPAPATGAATTNYKTRGTGKVSKDTVTVKGTAFDCEKVESESTTTVDGKEYKAKSAYWVCDKVSFRYYWDEKANATANADFKWEGKPSVKGGYVKSWSESSGTTSEMNLVAWGNDAKMSVKLPAPK